jgi:hypothetical protein
MWEGDECLELFGVADAGLAPDLHYVSSLVGKFMSNASRHQLGSRCFHFFQMLLTNWLSRT